MADRTQTIHLLIHTPDHAPRAEDPYYSEFQAVRKRLQDQGLFKCVVCGATENVELHHSHVEFSMMNGVDVEKLNEVLGLHLSDADFAQWIDSPDNLEPLCVDHHRGSHGIHITPVPLWELLRVEKTDLFQAKGNI